VMLRTRRRGKAVGDKAAGRLSESSTSEACAKKSYLTPAVSASFDH
jgi:hypothetical protein